MTPDGQVDFFLTHKNFNRHGAPATTPEYVTYRDNVLAFIKMRNHRIADWVRDNHADIEVRE